MQGSLFQGPLPDVRSGRRRRTGRPTETSGRGNFAPDGARRRADASMDATRPVPDGAPDGRSGPGRGRTQPDGPGRGRTGARRRTGPPTGAGPEARPAGRHSPDGARRGPDRVKTSPGQTARAPDRTSARGPFLLASAFRILLVALVLGFFSALAQFLRMCTSPPHPQ